MKPTLALQAALVITIMLVVSCGFDLGLDGGSFGGTDNKTCSAFIGSYHMPAIRNVREWESKRKTINFGTNEIQKIFLSKPIDYNDSINNIDNIDYRGRLADYLLSGDKYILVKQFLATERDFKEQERLATQALQSLEKIVDNDNAVCAGENPRMNPSFSILEINTKAGDNGYKNDVIELRERLSKVTLLDTAFRRNVSNALNVH